MSDDRLTHAWQALAQGDHAHAEGLFAALLAAQPVDPLALVGMASLLRQQGRLRDAVLHCDAALRIEPRCLEAWLERGYVLNAGGSFAPAQECYRQVLALDPAHPAAHAALAALAARDGQPDLARHHGQAALSAEPDNALAAAALAAVELEAGDAPAARDLLAPFAAKSAPASAERIQLLTTYGDALARSGAADAAYAAYAEAQTGFAALHEPPGQSRTSHRDLIERVTAEMAAAPKAAWSQPVSVQPAKAAAQHVFLLGYPRSGTTLVENVLASLHGVEALEERPTLVEADRAFLAEPGGITRLAQLQPTELAPFSAAYWDKVEAAGVQAVGQTFVDMDPLKATRLPLIARLFPAARILIMRRDPRDVVLSCFRTSFALTSAALEFTNLERAARHYDAMMRLIDAARAHLPLAFHEVDYHALVRDFDGTTRALCTFLGLPWDEALRRFDRTAQNRGVATASASQVRRGLYDGRGQWQPFARHFEPVLPILQPWIEKFGYA
ncbi:MAG: sulfotransferase family protein [Sphingomonadaceae bacterium]|nr:sulfotransferase family protein [Sphingomonadaceae bacterium]